jgi:hypothetical protein
VALLALGAGLLIAVGLVRVEVVTERRLVEVARGGWGGGREQFGLLTAETGRLYGPRSFAVAADGSLCVADTYNRRLVVIGGQGQPGQPGQPGQRGQRGQGGQEPVRVNVDVPAPLMEAARGRPFVAEDIACGGGGLVCIAGASGPQVLVFKGQEVLGPVAGPVSPDGEWLLEGLWVAGGDLFLAAQVVANDVFCRNLYAVPLEQAPGAAVASGTAGGAAGGATPPWRAVARLALDASGTRRCVTSIFDAPNILPAGNRIFTLGPGRDRFERVLRAFSPGGELLWEDRLEMPRLADTAELVGADSRGRVYVGVDLHEADATVLAWSTPPPGRQRAVAPARRPAQLTLGAPAGEVLARVRVRVTPQGDVFWAHADREGYAMRCWRTRRHWRLVPRLAHG